MIAIADVVQLTFDSMLWRLPDLGVQLPPRQFINIGEPVYDQEQFCVSTPGFGSSTAIYQGTPGYPLPGWQQATGGVVNYNCDFTITICRAWPGLDQRGGPPKPELLNDATLIALNDAQQMHTAFFAADAANEIVGQFNVMFYKGTSYQGPSGDMLGTKLDFSVEL